MKINGVAENHIRWIVSGGELNFWKDRRGCEMSKTNVFRLLILMGSSI